MKSIIENINFDALDNFEILNYLVDDPYILNKIKSKIKNLFNFSYDNFIKNYLFKNNLNYKINQLKKSKNYQVRSLIYGIENVPYNIDEVKVNIFLDRFEVRKSFFSRTDLLINQTLINQLIHNRDFELIEIYFSNNFSNLNQTQYKDYRKNSYLTSFLSSQLINQMDAYFDKINLELITLKANSNLAKSTAL